MKSAAAIQFDEFAQHTTFSGEKDNYKLTVREHPEFGKWEERTIDLPFVKITEHKTNLNQRLNVKVYDETLTDQVNHCMCVDGSLGAHFGQHNLSAELSPGNYHYMTVQANEYLLAMSKSFHNIHIQINRKHYSSFLCDDEAWSATLKENILNDEICYPGEFSLTPSMFKTIFDIFSSPLSGSLKKLLIEAKVLELVALQLNTSLIKVDNKKVNKRSKDVLHEVKEYLENSFLEEHSLRSICQRFGVNEFALKNGFKETFQTTVFEFILSRRLEHARDLLLNADCTIQEVGSKVGYKYPNHFSTAFKNKFGISPGKLSASN
jgi:AraC family transcriptional regulator, transcriptional activator of the genes for pyochelin and ferripyochelin receptors